MRKGAVRAMSLLQRGRMPHRSARRRRGKRKSGEGQLPIRRILGKRLGEISDQPDRCWTDDEVPSIGDVFLNELYSPKAIPSPVQLHGNRRRIEEARKLYEFSPFVIEDFEGLLLGFPVLLRNLKLQGIAIKRPVILGGLVQLDVA
jgi:hypothetical protein